MLCVLAALASVQAGQEDAAHPEAVRVERLVGLARVWGHCKFFHPALADRTDVDWDAALVAAIPEVRRSRTPEEYALAVQSMLARLEDPLTRVIAPAGDAAQRDVRQLGHRMTDEGVLVITVGNYYGLWSPEAQPKLQEIAAAAQKARGVVFDLRARVPIEAYGRLQLAGAFNEIQRRFINQTLMTSGERRRAYYGFPSNSVFSSGQYRSGHFVQQGSALVPAAEGREVPVVFLLNEHAGILPATLPMQAAGKALIVYEGLLARHSIGEIVKVELGDGLTAQVRQSQGIFADGTSAALQPDAIVERGEDAKADAALDRAVELANAFEPSRLERQKLPAVFAPNADRSYAEMRYPDLEYRLLALFRLWSAIEHFYPYKELLDVPWEQSLREMIPLFEAASDEKEYNLAIAAMAVRICDSHAYMNGPVFNEQVIPTGYPPIRVRMIEDVPVVTALFDAESAKRAGIEVGDVVVEVDGEEAAHKFADCAKLISASTPQGRMDKASLAFMNGPVGSKLRLTLRGRDNALRQVELERRHEDFTTLYHRERDGEIIRILPGNIGYVDLDRLTFDKVDPMFEQLKDTRGIIFDMRGYPYGTIWAIAPRLADESCVVALFETPSPGHGSPAPSAEAFVQKLEPAPPGQAKFSRRTVMLMDERTMSQAEHTGLYLKAANQTTFVGSQTAGANGEITSILLPGGTTLGFTGQSVRFPDGRQLQRVGLTPDVEVKPTIEGIRAGRDEVLEAALRLFASE